MFVYPSLDVIGYADVEHGMYFVSEDIDVVLFFHLLGVAASAGLILLRFVIPRPPEAGVGISMNVPLPAEIATGACAPSQ